MNLNGGAHFAADLRRELCARNAEYALRHRLAHVESYGGMPVTVYAPEADLRHGNFYGPSYRKILRREEWARRLEKIHSQAKRSLPRVDRRWRELDSCTSSDALLMNIFCCPRVSRSKSVAAMLGSETTDVLQFGYRAGVPLRTANGRERFDRTEVDMKLGGLLVESKLTETDFQTAPAALVETYRDLEQVFDPTELPRSGERYASYQLIRNVLAAHAGGMNFCVMLDARRPDLLEAWHSIMRCIRTAELRVRCKVLTWQELSTPLPRGLRAFLDEKYGIGSLGHRTIGSSRVI